MAEAVQRQGTPVEIRTQLLTERELAELLNVSYWTIRKWKKEGQLVYLKFDQAVRFRLSDVQDFIEQHLVNNNKEAV